MKEVGLVVDPADVAEALLQSRVPCSELRAPSFPGVYAFFLQDSNALRSFTSSLSCPIYVGLSHDLSRREFEEHLSSDNTGFSTLRRSLGAILKQELNLVAISRSAGTSEANVRNYRFSKEGEGRLTRWMHRNLLVAVMPSADPKPVEKRLVAHLEPVLNLTHWPNPDRKMIKELRKVCADEARLALKGRI